MYENIRILNAKLQLPRTFGIIPRERLDPLLADIPEYRLTTVTAGAGFGKTSLIAQACGNLGLDTVWYRLDRSDRDYITFLCYLIAGIRQYYSGFGMMTIHCMNEAEVTDQCGQEAVLTHFLGDIETEIKKDILIVLDDYQLIQDSRAIKHTLDFILPNLPPKVHLVLISRSTPDLSLSRFRIQREVLDITETDIVFSTDEIDAFYAQCLNLPLSPENLRLMQQKTHGWAAGLILIYNSLKGRDNDGINRLLTALKGSHRDIATYLGENVFDLQPMETRNFLLKTAILSRMNPVFCNHLLEIDNAFDILVTLENHHLFTFPYDDLREWYYYHHLFQDFLRTKMKTEMDAAAVRQLNTRAAALWEERGQPEESISHYIAAEQFEPACRLLDKIGKRCIEEGRIQVLSNFIEAIPDRFLKQFPWVQFSQAKVLECSGNLYAAIQEYKKAQKTFQKQKNPKGMDMCLLTLGRIYYQVGDFSFAEKILKQQLTQFNGNPRLCVEILGSLIFITSHQGKIKVADNYIKQGESILSTLPEKQILAWFYFYKGFRYCFTGDFEKALQLGRQTRAICESYGMNHLLAYNYHLLSWAYYYSGLFSEGLESAGKGLDLVKTRGYQDSSSAWLLADLALNTTDPADMKTAFQNGEQSLKIFRDQGSVWGQVWAYQVLYDICVKTGDWLNAEKYIRTGLDVLKGSDLPLHKSFLNVKLAKCLFELNNPREIPQLLDTAKNTYSSMKIINGMADILYARFFQDEQDTASAVQAALSGLKISRDCRYDSWMIAEKEWIIPLLLECHRQGHMTEYIRSLFQKMGGYSRNVLLQLKKTKCPQTRKAAEDMLEHLTNAPPPDLEIRCFGRFRIFQGGEEITDTQWKSKKAKMIFKYLAYTHHRGFTAKEVLMELLWPDTNPEKTSGRLHDALSALRKTLEPDIQRNMSSSYLLRDGSAYRLNMGNSGRIDVHDFRNEIKLAETENDPEKVVAHLLKAEALYRGDFLEEDTYIEWCDDERHRLRQAYLNLLEKIIHHYDHCRHYSQCVEYANKYLTHDKYAEHIYRQLMGYYAETGNLPMVVRTFEQCRENILKGYDSPVSPETEALFMRIKGDTTYS